MGEINPKAIYGFAEARKLVGFGETFFRTETAARADNLSSTK